MTTNWKTLLALIGLVAIGAQTAASELRESARQTALWALEAENPTALADSLKLFVQEGGTLTPGDPYSGADLIDGLRALPGGLALAQSVLSTKPRGQLGGAPRTDVIVAPGASHNVPLQLVAGEISWIEARLWSGSLGADIDLVLTRDDGTELARDVSNQSGIEGYGALLKVVADTCLTATLSVTNVGDAPGRVAILIPQSVRNTCEDPG